VGDIIDGKVVFCTFHQAKRARTQMRDRLPFRPVVFHVLHFNGVENISDDQILNALAILNRDYRKLNADTANVHPDFQGMPADIEIEFKLATIAPNGQCFSGITRYLFTTEFPRRRRRQSSRCYCSWQ